MMNQSSSQKLELDQPNFAPPAQHNIQERPTALQRDPTQQTPDSMPNFDDSAIQDKYVPVLRQQQQNPRDKQKRKISQKRAVAKIGQTEDFAPIATNRSRKNSKKGK